LHDLIWEVYKSQQKCNSNALESLTVRTLRRPTSFQKATSHTRNNDFDGKDQHYCAYTAPILKQLMFAFIATHREKAPKCYITKPTGEELHSHTACSSILTCAQKCQHNKDKGFIIHYAHRCHCLLKPKHTLDSNITHAHHITG